MTTEQLIEQLRTIKLVGVVNWRHDGEAIDEAIRIIREYERMKFASDANLKTVDKSSRSDESPSDE